MLASLPCLASDGRDGLAGAGGERRRHGRRAATAVNEEQDRLVRAAAFAHLDALTRRHGDVLPWEVLQAGFPHEGRTVKLLGPQGIFTPAGMEVPLSIATAPERPSRERPYDDELGPDGFLRYRYRGTDPRHRDNVGLRRAMDQGLPLVYFHGVAVGRYLALWPVVVHADDPASLTFTVALDEPELLRPDPSATAADEARRAYVTRLAVRRLHQAAFRQKVIAAYRTSCAVCRLRHGELLDAAHILPRARRGGRPDAHPRPAIPPRRPPRPPPPARRPPRRRIPGRTLRILPPGRVMLGLGLARAPADQHVGWAVEDLNL